MMQALKSTNFEIPTDNGTSKRCGVDFIKIEVPKNVRVKRNRRKKNKGKGKGKRSTGARGHDNAHLITTCESGEVVEATWIGTPPDHEAYNKKKKVLRSRREEQSRREAEKKAAKDNEEDREDQNVDQEYLDLGVDADLFAVQIDKEGEKDETFSSQNNNNDKQKTSTQDQTSKKKKKETEPEPESDRRKTYFFPTPHTTVFTLIFIF